jgi:hypothetical protein
VLRNTRRGVRRKKAGPRRILSYALVIEGPELLASPSPYSPNLVEECLKPMFGIITPSRICGSGSLPSLLTEASSAALTTLETRFVKKRQGLLKPFPEGG